MKERPILFSSEMVRAILEGRKTQTRRVLRLQPEIVDSEPNYEKHTWGFWRGDYPENGKVVRCPYGQPGERRLLRRLQSLHGGQRPRGLKRQERGKYP